MVDDDEEGDVVPGDVGGAEDEEEAGVDEDLEEEVGGADQLVPAPVHHPVRIRRYVPFQAQSTLPSGPREGREGQGPVWLRRMAARVRRTACWW